MTSELSIKKRVLFFVVPRIIKWLVILIGFTCKKKWVGREHLDALRDSNQNWIYSIWHNNILFGALLLKNQNLVSIVSSSEDGRIAANVLDLMGYQTLSGSTSRGGAKVMFSMIKEIRSGKCGAITPDGPRGPIYELQKGIISIAQKTGVPLVPFHVEATKQKIFDKSWDKHKFPKPFSTIIIRVGKPYQVPEKLSKNQFNNVCHEFERMMNENVQLTDKVKEIAKGNQ